jgi:hypothetical protein
VALEYVQASVILFYILGMGRQEIPRVYYFERTIFLVNGPIF